MKIHPEHLDKLELIIWELRERMYDIEKNIIPALSFGLYCEKNEEYIFSVMVLGKKFAEFQDMHDTYLSFVVAGEAPNNFIFVN